MSGRRGADAVLRRQTSLWLEGARAGCRDPASPPQCSSLHGQLNTSAGMPRACSADAPRPSRHRPGPSAGPSHRAGRRPARPARCLSPQRPANAALQRPARGRGRLPGRSAMPLPARARRQRRRAAGRVSLGLWHAAPRLRRGARRPLPERSAGPPLPPAHPSGAGRVAEPATSGCPPALNEAGRPPASGPRPSRQARDNGRFGVTRCHAGPARRQDPGAARRGPRPPSAKAASPRPRGRYPAG